MFNTKYFLGVLSVVMIAMTPLASATSVEKLDFDDMVSQSSVCIVGSLESSRTERREGQVVTLSTFRVKETAFGDVGPTVTIVSLGGETTLGGISVAEVVAGSPRFMTNQDSLLLLSNTVQTGEYRVMGFNQGRFTVVETAEGEMSVSLPEGEGGRVSLESAIGIIQETRSDPTRSDIDRE